MRYVAGCPNSVDVKSGSAFVELMPLPLASPSDAVAHYDQLEAAISLWPEGSVGTQAAAGAGIIEYKKARFTE